MCFKFGILCQPKSAGCFAFLFFVWIVAWSMFFERFQAPATYFAEVRNPFNLFLMKPSLYISVAVLLAFIFFTHYPLNNGCLRPTMLPIYRLVFGFLLYFGILALCRLVGEQYVIGAYSVACDRNGTECWEELERWFPITISGHVFTMFCSLLMIVEELAIVRQWKKIENTVLATEESQCCAVDPMEESKLISRHLFLKYAPYVKAMHAFLVVWSVFLEFAVFTTVVYFRQPYEKIGRRRLAVAHWRLTYRFVCFSKFIDVEVKKFELKSVTRYRTVDCV